MTKFKINTQLKHFVEHRIDWMKNFKVAKTKSLDRDVLERSCPASLLASHSTSRHPFNENSFNRHLFHCFYQWHKHM